MTRAWIALGSNLGDRAATIAAAVAALRFHPAIVVEAVSAVIETPPVGPPGQGPYLNAVARVRTNLCPRELLNALLAIERSLGRERARAERWGPRTIDLDLLLVDHHLVNEPGLTVPHPRMTERLFVLDPLAEIDPAIVIPGTGLTAAEHRDRLLAAERNS